MKHLKDICQYVCVCLLVAVLEYINNIEHPCASRHCFGDPLSV